MKQVILLHGTNDGTKETIHFRKLNDDDLKKLIQDQTAAFEKAKSTPGFQSKDYQFSRTVTPLLKEFIYRWWEKRETGKVPNAQYKPSKLKDELDKLMLGNVSDTHIMTLMYQQRSLQKRQQEESSPLKRLQTLLKNEEGNNVEVKRSLSRRLIESIAITVSAFANGSGGTIIVGLYEIDKIQPNAHDLVINGAFGVCGLGQSVDNDRILLTKYLGDNTTINLQRVSIELEVVGDKKVMLIHIPAYIVKRREVVFCGSEAYVREDNHNKKLTPKEIYTIARQLSGADGA